MKFIVSGKSAKEVKEKIIQCFLDAIKEKLESEDMFEVEQLGDDNYSKWLRDYFKEEYGIELSDEYFVTFPEEAEYDNNYPIAYPSNLFNYVNYIAEAPGIRD